jgi:hypothetical protein
MSLIDFARRDTAADPEPVDLAAALEASEREKQDAIKEAIVRHSATLAYVTEATESRLREIDDQLDGLVIEQAALQKLQARAAGIVDPLPEA